MTGAALLPFYDPLRAAPATRSPMHLLLAQQAGDCLAAHHPMLKTTAKTYYGHRYVPDPLPRLRGSTRADLHWLQDDRWVPQ